MALRDAVRKLPVEQREVVLLHYLEGYTAEEIARILGTSLGRIKHQLIAARHQLQRELGEGDWLYLNEPSVPMRQWGWLPLDQIHVLATCLTSGGSADRDASRSGATLMEDTMERREFLRHAAVGAAGLMLPEAEKEVIDSRLTQKVTCAFKGAALSDLCEQLRSDTGVQVAAGPSVADEKVSLFCEKLALRDVMRQLSRPFGYTWLRGGTPGRYRYELVRDLRSQLLEEELRNRDRNAALLALDREMQRYRPYLSLSPDEAHARARTASPEEKRILERLAGQQWGAIQMYFRLSPGDLVTLRAGQTIAFCGDPPPGELSLPVELLQGLRDRSLPPEIARGVLQSWRDWRGRGGQADIRPENEEVPAGSLPDAQPVVVLQNEEQIPTGPPPHAWPVVILQLDHKELGHVALNGQSGIGLGDGMAISGDHVAVGMSYAGRELGNYAAHPKLAHDPGLQRRVTVRPEPTCGPAALVGSPTGLVSEGKVTTADVLEALHRASGLPIVSDFYTRLSAPAALSTEDLPLFEALNRLADALHLRWNKDAEWLQLRSVSFFTDRLKEVPNRQLSHWASSRRQHGALTVEDLVEIAQLSDAQLDSSRMAEGARECWGLAEWGLAQNDLGMRPYWRFLAGLTPAQRQEAMSRDGLAFTRMSLAQQQQFVAVILASHNGWKLPMEELAGVIMRLDYSLTGWFQWMRPPSPGDPSWQELVPAPVRERTREAAL